jgi:hypothetical protein
MLWHGNVISLAGSADTLSINQQAVDELQRFPRGGAVGKASWENSGLKF